MFLTAHCKTVFPVLRNCWNGGSSGRRLAWPWCACSGFQHNMGEEGSRCHKRGVLSSIRGIWHGHSAERCLGCIAVLLRWMDMAESDLRRKLMSRKQAAEASIAGSASRLKKKKKKSRCKSRCKNSSGMLSEKTQKTLIWSQWIKGICDKLVFEYPLRGVYIRAAGLTCHCSLEQYSV